MQSLKNFSLKKSLEKIGNSDIANNPVVTCLKESVSEYKDYMNTEVYVREIKAHGSNIAHIKNQTPELCEIAIKQDGNYIAHIRNQTPELCLLAVKTNPESIGFIRNQTEELCRIAV